MLWAFYQPNPAYSQENPSLLRLDARNPNSPAVYYNDQLDNPVRCQVQYEAYLYPCRRLEEIV